MSASQQHVDEDDITFRASPSRARSSAGQAWLIAGVLLTIAVGLAYSAYQLWTQEKATREKLAVTNVELTEQKRASVQSAEKVVTLEQQKTERDTLLQQSNGKLLELNTALAAAETRLAELNEERSEIRDQLAEFRQLTQQFKRMIDSGRLEVSFRRGRMIVELPAQVLFPSGSAELTGDGGKALAEVAKILRTMRSRRYIVAGHTDNIPVATSQFRSNWELSTARAVEVTNALVRGGLRPEQLVAAGYSEYDPVARNATEKGRQKNRRIEIILEPRLAPMPGLEKPAKPAAPAKTAKAAVSAKKK
jgi:chemotaxis protein MotB